MTVGSNSQGDNSLLSIATHREGSSTSGCDDVAELDDNSADIEGLLLLGKGARFTPQITLENIHYR